jgi:polysaccharide export outer membrane protein
VKELENSLSKEYANYIKRPVVTVLLLAPRPLRVAIAGEINSPGSYTIPIDGTKFPSLTELIQKAAGITTVADISQVQIRRFLQGRQQVIRVNLWELIRQGTLNPNITLRDGDSIFIPTKTTAQDPNDIRQLSDANFGLSADQELNVVVIGEVNRPGSYRVIPQQGQNTNSGGTAGNPIRRKPPTLTNAIQLAGGIKPLANIRQIEVHRFTRDGQQQTIPVDLWSLLQTGNIDEDPILQDGDTITIPTAKDLSPQEAEPLASASFAPATMNINVVGEVNRPGLLQLPPNTPLNQAILAAGNFNNRRADQSTVDLIRLNPNGTVTKRSIKIDFAQSIANESNPALRNNDVVVVYRNSLTATTDTIDTLLSPFSSLLGVTSIINTFRNNTRGL